MHKSQNLYRKILAFIFALISTYALNIRNGLYVGNCPEHPIGNILSRLYSAFGSMELADFFVLCSLCVLFYWGLNHLGKVKIGTMAFSGLLSIVYLLALFYRNYNSTLYLYCDAFQLFIALFEVFGIGIVIYFLLNTLDWYFNKCLVRQDEPTQTCFWKKHFFPLASGFIFLCWLLWLAMTYPGSTNPDSIVQLKNFYGDMERTAWQPPFSTLIMGGLFHIGRTLVDANFGFFLYNLFQGIVGALVFAYSLNRLVKRGVPFALPVIGTLFFGLTPMWGAYVQWFEKDFLYTVSVVLFVTLVAEVLLDRQCTLKMLVCICLSGIAMALLRNNGIYVILPTLIASGIYLKNVERKRILTSLAIVFVVYELVVKAIYPAMGIGKTSIAETIGFMFQATARYVQEYPGEVTDYEKEVLIQNFQHMDNFQNYDPRIVDPVKIYYNHTDFGSYVKIWLNMFLKHPMVYVESYLNSSYGYMAPVSTDIGAYVMLSDYDPYLKELGVSHVDNGNLNYIAVWLWHLSTGLPVLKYLASPGLYTWLSLIALWLFAKNKRPVGVILLIPNIINILVCTASPLADAMRYALPAVAVMPLILGWTYIVKDAKYQKE
ncbi:MAG: hypothetical protein IJW63_04855 [Lachnospiraceae bacterium]|nr:hypothetical protein [Lachnospiraceae bacterium]